MKGRYEHGSIFDVQDNYTVPFNPDERTDVYGKPIQDEEYIRNLTKPQFNCVKPALPAYSFPKDERFRQKPLYMPKQNSDDYYNDLKINEDIIKKKGSNKQTFMGTSQRGQCFNSNNCVPGPSQYKIPGFGDYIVFNYGAKKQNSFDNYRKKMEYEKSRTHSKGFGLKKKI